MRTLLPLLLLALAYTPGTAAPIFRLGFFDYSSEEFSPEYQRPGFETRLNVSVPSWPTFQASGTKSPELKFSLAQPAAAYRLRVAVIIARPGVPALRVTLNGKTGLYYPSPKLDYHGGDLPNSSRAGYSHAVVEADLPAYLFRTGENVLALQPVASRETPSPESGFYWDAVELLPLEQPVAVDDVSTRVDPTIFYQQTDTGLGEIIEVFLRANRKIQNAKVTLALEGRRFTRSLSTAPDFGEQRVEFLVPEFAQPTAARVTAALDGRQSVHEQQISPAKKWRLLVVSHIHLDLSYNNYMPNVASIQARVLDEAMDLHKYYPEYRFATDGQLPIDEFNRTRSDADRARLVQAMRDGVITSPAAQTSVLTGFPTTETLIRQFVSAANFSRLNQTPLEYVSNVDVASYSWSYASVIAASGLKYFLSGSDNIRGPILLNGRLHERSPFWWTGPDGSRVLMWFAFVYRQTQILFGLPVIPEVGRETLPIFFQSYERPDYTADSVLFFGTYGENRDIDANQATLVRRWNALYAFPKFEFASVPSALADIERQLGDKIPTLSGDGGPLWEDGLNGNPIRVALAKQTERRAASVEKLATISSLTNPRVSPDKQRLDEMWQNLVTFDEHTGCPMVSIPEHEDDLTVEWWHRKGSFIENARLLASWIGRNASGTICDVLPIPAGSLVVFNTLNWPRSARVTHSLKNGYDIVDAATRERIPFRILAEGEDFRRVEFLTQDLPATGYKTYLLRRSVNSANAGTPAGHETSPSGETAPITLENQYYRLTLDPATAALSSVFDKQLNRELVDQTFPYKLGQFVYVTGGDKVPTAVLRYSPTIPAPEYTLTGAANGKIIARETTPEGESVTLQATAPNDQTITTEIRLINHAKRIEFTTTNRRRQTFQRESAYLAWPLAFANPDFSYEIQNGVVHPSRDMLPGAGAEWFSVQHWAKIADQRKTAAAIFTLDNPLITLGDISRRLWLHSNIGPRPPHIFSFIYTNYHQPHDLLRHWDIPARYDTLTFRHALVSGDETQTADVALSRLGWELATPAEANFITERDKSWARPATLDAKRGSFLEIADPAGATLVSAWKPAEDGQGTILRLLDLGAGQPRQVTVTLPLLEKISVSKTDALERGADKLPSTGQTFTTTLAPHEIQTIRITGQPTLPPLVIPPHKDSTPKLVRPYIEQDP